MAEKQHPFFQGSFQLHQTGLFILGKIKPDTLHQLQTAVKTPGGMRIDLALRFAVTTEQLISGAYQLTAVKL
jgi:hypothetical protein